LSIVKIFSEGSLMFVVCSYCGQECDPADSVIHRVSNQKP
jgi:hypothetical protein